MKSMRLLILSDSHGNVYNLQKALLKHPDAEQILFLGDGERDFSLLDEELKGRPVTMVSGNCDIGSMLHYTELLKINGQLIYMTHGHKQSVKYSDDILIQEAKKTAAKLVLYGHTHEQIVHRLNGMQIMNPGSINERKYGIADVTEMGIVLSEMDLSSEK